MLPKIFKSYTLGGEICTIKQKHSWSKFSIEIILIISSTDIIFMANPERPKKLTNEDVVKRQQLDIQVVKEEKPNERIDISKLKILLHSGFFPNFFEKNQGSVHQGCAIVHYRTRN